MSAFRIQMMSLTFAFAFAWSSISWMNGTGTSFIQVASLVGVKSTSFHFPPENQFSCEILRSAVSYRLCVSASFCAFLERTNHISGGIRLSDTALAMSSIFLTTSE